MSEAFCEFTVPVRARGKGRPRFTMKGHAYTDKNTARYEALIATYAREAMQGKQPTECACLVSITAYFLPSARMKKDERLHVLEFNSPYAKKPDADNILKAVCDAMNGIVYTDDALVAVTSCGKHYGDYECVCVRVELL